MRLHDAHGNAFQLSLIVHESQHQADLPDEDDWQWMLVEVAVATPERVWNGRAQSLLLGEAQSLAMWLANIATGATQDYREAFIEQELELLHRASSESEATIVVRLSGDYAPPGAEEYELKLTVPKVQLAEAAADLQEELRRFESIGYRTRSHAPLLPTFIIDWRLTVPGEGAGEAVALVKEFMQRIDLEAEITSSVAVTEEPYRWEIEARTVLDVPGREYGLAALRLLTHLPHPYGSPRIGPLVLRPSGSFEVVAQMDPIPELESEDDRLGQVRGWLALSNHDDSDRFTWWAKTRRSTSE